MELKKLLVHVDSDKSYPALFDKAVRLAAENGEAHLLCSTNQPDSAWTESLARKAEKQLRAVSEQDERPDLVVSSEGIDEDEPLPPLLTAIHEQQPDLVLFPIEPGSLLFHLIQPPESWTLIRDADVPVLLSQRKTWKRPIRIAAAIDPFNVNDRPIELDLKLLRWGRDLSHRMGAEFHVVHAYTTLPQSAIFDEHVIADYGELQEHVEAQHRQRIAQLMAPWTDEPGAAEVHLLQGEFHQVLPEFCDDQQIDLLLVGNVHRGWLERLLLGSSVERIIDNIRCDLLVLKPDEEDQDKDAQ